MASTGAKAQLERKDLNKRRLEKYISALNVKEPKSRLKVLLKKIEDGSWLLERAECLKKALNDEQQTKGKFVRNLDKFFRKNSQRV